MAQLISVEANISDTQKALAETGKSIKSIQRKTLAIIGRFVVKTIKTNIRASGLKKRTGELLKTYRYKIKKNNLEANVYPKSIDKTRKIFPKIMALSYGSEVRNLQPRGFIQSAKQKAETGTYQADIEKMIDKELKKYWG